MKKFSIYIVILTIILQTTFSFLNAYASVANPDELCNNLVAPTNQPCSIGCSITSFFTKQTCTDNRGTWLPFTAGVGGGGTTSPGTGTTNPPSSTTYTFLAPMPCKGTPADGCVGGKLTTFDPAGPNKLGIYLDIMLKIFIGICAVLAVIMIVVGGIEYMTSELLNTKEQGRHRINGAIFGLILALSAWTILNTINPALLSTKLDSLESVTVEVETNQELATDLIPDDGTKTPPAGAIAKCSSGVQKTSSGMIACNDIGVKLDAMVLKAREANINLTGGGFRTFEEQTALRKKNCTDVNNSKTCKPPTATPGRSMHESGLAFDLKCNGVKITDQTNDCYKWLASNAGTYGLYNLPSEPWHWSTTGH